MNFANFLLPLLRECRKKYGEWSLMLEMDFLRVESEDVKEMVPGEDSIDENGLIRVKQDGKELTARSREVRYKVSEPCCNLSKYLSRMVACNHKIGNHFRNAQKALTFCTKNHIKTMTKLELKQESDVPDEIFLQMLELVLQFHRQTVVDFNVYTIEKISYPLGVPSEFYVFCENLSEGLYSIQVFDKDGWNICKIDKILFVRHHRPQRFKNCVSVKQNDVDEHLSQGETAPGIIHSAATVPVYGSQSEFQNGSAVLENNPEVTEENKYLQKTSIQGLKYQLDEPEASKKLNSKEQNCELITTSKKNTRYGMPEQQLNFHKREYVRDKVRKVLREFVDDITDDNATFTRLGLDSLRIAMLESQLRIELKSQYVVPDGCAFENKSINSLADFLHKRAEPESAIRKTLQLMVKNLEEIPLSKVQQRLVFMERFDKANGSQFIETYLIRLENLERKRLNLTLNRLIARQNILRTLYTVDSQIVLSLTESFISLFPKKRKTNAHSMNIFEKSPIEIEVQADCSQLLIVILTVHHIMIDGFSMSIFIHELTALYENKKLPILETTYAEWTLKEMRALEESNYIQSRQNYWNQLFFTKNLQHIPTDEEIRVGLRQRSGYIRLAVHKKTAQMLRFLKTHCDTTLFACIVSIFHLLVHKLYGIEYYCSGISVSQRNDLSLRSLIGCFINLVPILTKLEPTETVTDFILKTSKVISEALVHQLPFESVIRAINFSGAVLSSAPFRVMLVLDAQISDAWALSAGAKATLIKQPPAVAKYDQVWYFENIGDNVVGITVEYSSCLYHKSTIVLLLEKFLKLIGQALQNRNSSIKDLSLVNSSEQLNHYKSRMKNLWDFPFNRTASELITKQLKRKFYYNCIMYKNRTYSGFWLDREAANIAKNFQNEFLKHYGECLKVDRVVVILLNRIPQLLALVVALWRCGVAVVPLSVTWPSSIIEATIRDLGYPPIFFSEDSTDIGMLNALKCMKIDIQNQVVLQTKPGLTLQRQRQNSYNLAYITFTSGTTSKPKGVCTDFIGLNNLMMCYTEILAISPNSSVYQVVNVAFDIFFADFLEALSNGAKLVLAKKAIPSVEELQLVSHAYIMPAFLSCLKEDRFCHLQNLAKLHFGGETIQSQCLRQLINKGLDVFQQYGLTEHTVYTTLHRIKTQETIKMIGKPMKNMFLTSAHASPACCPPPSEFRGCVFGVGLSRGYFGTNLKANNFLDNCSKTREDSVLRDFGSCFITDDTIKFNTNGEAKFCLRIDRAVKIRGMTVNLGEVESCISRQPYVQACAVTLIKRNQTDAIGACLTLTETVSKETFLELGKNIKNALTAELPNYMIPAEIIVQKNLPTNSNGKTDYKKIKLLLEIAAEKSMGADTDASYASEEDRKYYGMFEEVLQKAEVKPGDIFFDIGGDSLKALLLQEKIEEQFAVPFDVKDIFRLQQTGKIVEQINKKLHLKTRNISSVKSYNNRHLGREEDILWLLEKHIPLSFQQEGIWFQQQQFQRNNDCYNIKIEIEINQKVPYKLMRYLLNSIVMKHSTLRIFIKSKKLKTEQIIQSGTESFFALANTQQDFDIDFQVENRIPLKIATVFGNQTTCTIFDIHHILIDGASLEIIKKDFVETYFAPPAKYRSNKNQKVLKATSYAFWSVQQRRKETQFLKELENLKTSLKAFEPLKIPYDFPDDLKNQKIAAHYEMPLGLPLELLNKFCTTERCSIFTLLLTGYSLVMSFISGMKKFAVAMPVANRSLDTANTVGFFANTVILRINVDFSATNELIASIQDSLLEALKYQTIPFELTVRALNPERKKAGEDFLQNSVVMHEAASVSIITKGEVEISIRESPPIFAKYDQSWSFARNGEKLLVHIEHCEKIFSHSKIELEFKAFQTAVTLLINSGVKKMIPTSSILQEISKLFSDFVLIQKSHITSTENDKDPENKDAYSLRKKEKLILAEQARRTHTKIQDFECHFPSAEEKQIKQLWEETLKCSVSLNDNFFEIGGHSLLAAKLCVKIYEKLGYDCPLSLLYANQTVRSLTKALFRNKDSSAKNENRLLKDRQLLLPACDLQKPILNFYANQPSFSMAYNTGFTVCLKDLEVERLRKSFNRVIMIHPALRTSFLFQKKDPFQVAHSGTESFVQVRSSFGNVSPIPSPFVSIPITVFLEKNRKNWMLKVELSHLIADYRSLEIIARDLSNIYAGKMENRKKTAEYASFTTKFKQKIATNKERCEKYWGTLLGKAEIPNLSILRKNLTLYDYQCGNAITLFPGLHTIAAKVADEANVSLFTVMITVFGKCLLRRMHAEDKVFVACPFDLRDHFTRNTVGFLVQTLPVLVDFRGRKTEWDVMKKVFIRLQEAHENTAVATDFIYDTCLNGEKLKTMIVAETDSAVYPQTWVNNPDGGQNSFTKYEITFFVKICGNDVELRIEYMKSLFDREAVVALGSEWATTISSLRRPTTQEPDRIKNVDIPEVTIIEIIKRAAKTTNSSYSLLSKQEMLTYHQFSSAINETAQYLLQSSLRVTGNFLRSDTILPVIATKTIDVILLCLAILNAGASYLPLDKTTPKQRLYDILSDIGTEYYFAKEDSNLEGVTPLLLNLDLHNSRVFSKTVRSKSQKNNNAYTIYTSGTTGKPKGTVVEHRNVVNLAIESSKHFFIKATDCIYQFTNFCFDNSILEIIMALTNGNRLFVKEDGFMAKKFIEETKKHRVTHALLFPSLVEIFDSKELVELKNLRYWIVGAEKVSGEVLYRALQDGISIIQNYGPTETTAYALFKHMRIGDHPNNLGKAISNTKAIVMNHFLEIAPNFTVNELHLEGINVMRGYVKSTNSHLKDYPSGDLVRRLPDGNIIFIGRLDRQVKIRGFRVELTEIETILLKYPHLKQAKVVLKQPENILIAYVILKDNKMSLNATKAQDFCRQYLPYYMIPSQIHQIEAIPLTANSKVDWKQLEKSEILYEAPKSEKFHSMKEKKLLSIYSKLLGSPNITVEDDFFLIGGNSLSAKKLAEWIEDEFGTQVRVGEIFACRTIKCLAEMLEKKSKDSVLGQRLDSTLRDNTLKFVYKNRVPLSYEQQQMYYLNSTKLASYYNLKCVQNFPVTINFRHLRNAFQRLVLEQCSLRTVFKEVQHDIFQFLLSGTETYFSSQFIDTEKEMNKKLTEVARESVDMSAIPPLKCLIRKENGFTVTFLVNHIISDAWSTRLIETELNSLYKESTGSGFRKHHLEYTYADYSLEQQNLGRKERVEEQSRMYAEELLFYVLKSKSIWLEHTSPEALLEFQTYSALLEGSSYQNLLKACSRFNVSPSQLFLAALALTVHQVTSSATVVIGMVTANRSNRTKNIVGNFLNTLLIPSLFEEEDDVPWRFLECFKKNLELAHHYESVPLFSLLSSVRNLAKCKYSPEILFNCRYNLEDGATNHISVPKTPSIDKCLHAVELDVDLNNEGYVWAMRVHDRANLNVTGKSFMKLYAKTLAYLTDRALDNSQDLKVIVPQTVPSDEVCTLNTETTGKHGKLKEVKQKLEEIWYECLNHKTFTETDDFLFIGGNSLTCLKLQRLIKVKFSLTVPLEELLDNTIFAAMLTLIQKKLELGFQNEGTATVDFMHNGDVIVKLKACKQISQLLLLMHPLVGGAIFPYMHLVKEFEKINERLEILGVQHPNSFSSLKSDNRYSNSIEELCTAYIQHLLPWISKAETISVCGASLGGVLAYEIASQLMEKGYSVKNVIIIDSNASKLPTEKITFEEHAEQALAIINHFADQKSIEENVRKSIVENSWELLGMRQRYEPKPNFQIKGTLLKVKDEKSNYGWDKLCQLEVEAINGSHATMLDEANSKAVAKLINQILQNSL